MRVLLLFLGIIMLFYSCTTHLDEEETGILESANNHMDQEFEVVNNSIYQMLFAIKEVVKNHGKRKLDVEVMEEAISLYSEYQFKLNQIGSIEANMELPSNSDQERLGILIHTNNKSYQKFYLAKVMLKHITDLAGRLGDPCRFDELNLVKLEKQDSVHFFFILNHPSGYLIEKLEVSSSVKSQFDENLVDPWTKVEFKDRDEPKIKVIYRTRMGNLKEAEFDKSGKLYVY